MTARTMIVSPTVGWTPLWPDGGITFDRESLVRGAYEPSDSTTGPMMSSGFVDQESNTSGIIQLTTAGMQCFGTTHWGEVRHQAPDIHHEQCRFPGADYNKMYAGTYGANGSGYLVKSYGGTGYYHWSASNSIFDSNLWVSERGRAPMRDTNFVHIDGIEGGDCELKFCSVRNVVDPLHFLHQENIVDSGNHGFSSPTFNSPSGNRFCVIDRCLFEKGMFVQGFGYLYVNGLSGTKRPGAQNDARPHGDGIQIMQGKNLWVTGTKIGGVRDYEGYRLWPNTGIPGNTGMDFPNAVLQIKQEGSISSSDVRWLDNITIEDSFLQGGGSFCVNFAVGSGNTLSGVKLRRLKIAQRRYGDGFGRGPTGAETSVGGGYGYYRNNVQGALWQDITVKETGVLIPSGTNQAQ